jgi:ParB family chromosome partitioning protein
VAKLAKHALGKGLDALLHEADASEFFASVPASPASAAISGGLPVGIEQGNVGALTIDVSLLKPNPRQPRKDFNAESLDELASSIRENGVIQPVIVEDAGDGTFYIIAGERRTRAAQLAGLKKIPVVLKAYSDERKLEIALIENIQRENLNPIEEAEAYYNLMQLKNLTQEEVADLVGKKRPTVGNALRLLKLPEDMRSSLISGTLSAGHARALLSVTDTANQRVLFARIVGSGMSVREAEQYAGELSSSGKSVPAKRETTATPQERDPDFTNLEQQFIDALGTNVNLKGSFDRGSIQIDFFSRNDLDRLYELITKKV